MPTRPLLIGTRGSPLALWQARHVWALLLEAHGLGEGDVDLSVITTSGDRIKDAPLRDFGGKGLFTKEIDEALLRGDVDLAVHSMKDLPTFLPENIVIAAVLPRADVRDAFVSPKAPSLAELPPGAVVGTSSLRRGAQLKRLRPDLRVIDFRGNVETRLSKLDEGQADATLLALAGLERLGLAAHATSVLSTEEMLPAVAQGAIGVTCRGDDAKTRPRCSRRSTTRHRRRPWPASARSSRASTAPARRRSPVWPRSTMACCAFVGSSSPPTGANGTRSGSTVRQRTPQALAPMRARNCSRAPGRNF